MREALARLLALATGLVVLIAAIAFAGFQNSGGPAAVAAEPAPAAAETARVERGRAVYDEQGCAACHSIAGEGNPRNPLDGVGARLTPEEIRAYTTADATVADDLAPRIAAAKKDYQKIPADDLDALVAYLASLR
jgi:mono/diheme cytochrome c family protein